MNELVEAIRRCDANEFSRILSHHPNPAATLNHRHRDGWTLTHHAACGNSIEIISDNCLGKWRRPTVRDSR